MFFLKNHKYLQQQWNLQKNFKHKFLQKFLILNNNIYYKLFFWNKDTIIFTKIIILTNYKIKIDSFKYKILKINKKKLSIILEESVDKFILTVNLKAFNIIL